MRANTHFLRNLRITVLGTWLFGGMASLLAVPVITIEENPTGHLLSWDGAEGLDYVLQGTDDLGVAIPWTDMGLSVLQPGGTGPYQVSVPINQTRKFYRLFNDSDPMTTEATKAYVGAARCWDCHPYKHGEWENGGHPHKLNKVEGGVPPTYFSSGDVNVPNPPAGVNWNDVSYVIGGAIWKARFIGQDGYIITNTPDPADGDLVQFNLANELHGESWATYHTGEMKPYNCGRCHTTGWVSTADGSVNQDGMEGMHGSFAASAIECEACHGPASRHVRNGLNALERKAEITIDTTAEMCGNCHNRGGVNATILASGGFIKHHEQYNEMESAGHGSTGADHECVTCHNPHKSVKVSPAGGGAPDGIIKDCVECHNTSPTSEGTIKHNFASNNHTGDATCVDCHMARASKSAVAINQYTGDIKTHIFKINTSATGEMFTTTGDPPVTTANGSTGVTLDFVCYQCHQDSSGVGGDGEMLDMSELALEADNYHGLP